MLPKIKRLAIRFSVIGLMLTLVMGFITASVWALCRTTIDLLEIRTEMPIEITYFVAGMYFSILIRALYDGVRMTLKAVRKMEL